MTLSHTAVGRWVTLSLLPSQQSYFLQGGPASLLGIPGTGLLLLLATRVSDDC